MYLFAFLTNWSSYFSDKWDNFANTFIASIFRLLFFCCMHLTSKIILTATLASTVFSLASQTIEPISQDTLFLSLDQCLEIALSENPTIKVADMEIKRMDYSKKETLAQLLPNISFTGTYSRTLAKQTMYMNMSRFGGGSSSGSENTEGSESGESASTPSVGGSGGIKVGLDNSYSTGFSASMPLIAPQLWKSLKLSDTQIAQSVEAARQSRISMVQQVQNAYYTLLLAEDSRKVIGESYDMAKFTADLYAKQYELGAATRYDVLRTQVAVKNVEPEITQADIAIRQAKLQLLILLGIDTKIQLKASSTLSDYEDGMYEKVLNFDTSDISGNSSLRTLDLQTRQLKDLLEVQKMSLYPTLSLTANYNWTSMQDGSPFKGFRWSPYSMIGLSLSFPLFEGGKRYSAIKQARIQVDEMKWQRENLVRSINSQTELALDNIQKNVAQISSCSESIKQAEMAHDIMKQSFEIGAASYLNLRDSELALTQSRLAYYQSIYNYLVATSELQYLLGNYHLK